MFLQGSERRDKTWLHRRLSLSSFSKPPCKAWLHLRSQLTQHAQVTLSAGVTSLTFGTAGNPKAKPDSPSDLSGITVGPIPTGSSVIFYYKGVVAASAAGTNITSTATGMATVRYCRWAGLLGFHSERPYAAPRRQPICHARSNGVFRATLWRCVT